MAFIVHFVTLLACVGVAIPQHDKELALEVAQLRKELQELKANCVQKRDLVETPGSSKRLLMPVDGAINTVAFSAYLTRLADGPSVGKLREIIFDKLESNIGSAYDKYTGTFRAPVDGVYAFTWTSNVAGVTNSHGEVWLDLIVNGQIHGNTHADTETDVDDDSSTGFVIKALSKGDTVFIRTGSNIPQGTLHGYMRWTFSGWLIA